MAPSNTAAESDAFRSALRASRRAPRCERYVAGQDAELTGRS